MSTAERPTPRADVEEREMTTEIDLLPMPKPEGSGLYRAWSYDQMEAYARANIAHAVAPLQVEVKALREALAELVSWIPSADVYRRLGFDPEAPMRAFERARALLRRELGDG